MIAAGMPAGTVIHAICEKGAVWFSYTSAGPGARPRRPRTRHARAPSATTSAGSWPRTTPAHMFFDETKRAMVSVEQHIAVASSDYLAEQELFDADAMDLMARHGLGVVRLDHHAPNSDDQIDYRVDPTIISTDIESVRLGKDLGASRAVELLAAQGITPAGLADGGRLPHGLRHGGLAAPQRPPVKHVDVRPADGVPVKPYEVLTAADLGLGEDVIHDDAGAAFLRHWLAASAAETASVPAFRRHTRHRSAATFSRHFGAGVIMQVETHPPQRSRRIDITEAVVQDEIYYGSQASVGRPRRDHVGGGRREVQDPPGRRAPARPLCADQ